MPSAALAHVDVQTDLQVLIDLDKQLLMGGLARLLERLERNRDGAVRKARWRQLPFTKLLDLFAEVEFTRLRALSFRFQAHFGAEASRLLVVPHAVVRELRLAAHLRPISRKTFDEDARDEKARASALERMTAAEAKLFAVASGEGDAIAERLSAAVTGVEDAVRDVLK